MKSSKSAGRYAQALLDLAIEQGSLDAVAADMKNLTVVCAENRDLELMLLSPIVKADKKIDVLKAIFGDFNKLSTMFVELIVNHGREANLPQIAFAFDGLLKAYKGIVPVTLVSAKKLDEGVKKTILSKVEGVAKGTLEVSEMIDESIIGGFIVKMGDQQIDASVISQLGKLKQRLTK